MADDQDAGEASGLVEPVVAVPPDARRFLLQVARSAIEAFLGSGEIPPCRAGSPALLQPRATFVTLWERAANELRGCRGEPFARRTLVESVTHMAVAAATDDPRFPPVRIEEVTGLRIGISALSPIAPIRPEAIEVGRHGLLIVRGRQAGLLLPEVPARYGWSREEFLAGICEKAGLRAQDWSAAGVELYGFETEEWLEET